MPAPSLAVRDWWRRANWKRSSLSRLDPNDEMSWAEAESMRSWKSVACSTVFGLPDEVGPMLKGDSFLKKKYRAESLCSGASW